MRTALVIASLWTSVAFDAAPRLNGRTTVLRSIGAICEETPGSGRIGLEKIAYLPIAATLRDGRRVEVGPFEGDEVEIGRALMNTEIRKGRTCALPVFLPSN